MPAALTIGNFSCATHLSVKTLRHYHRVGLLVPADVDAGTGYRRYTTDQIPTAQVIRRFRDLDMPLDEIHAVLEAPDLRARNELISAHLASLEQNLARTQSAVASLRDLLDRPSDVAAVSQRRVGAMTAAAVTAVISMDDLVPWYLGALGDCTPHSTRWACARPARRAGSTRGNCSRTSAGRPPSSSRRRPRSSG
jgi:DNA-binding transcriptional MerR regulator